MHLARLEINGFKSFGEKVVLEFAPGVTSIVGPNGSGKSNVVDAIRWALGEQGYKGIRLEKSDDVIFLGSKSKGKMSRASVEMLFKDVQQDRGIPYEELIVARQVYRDGEGEYFLNKAQVRLKDINEMLARAHVSTKNYSIVTQGMSDQLLRFSPQELRNTVEDASGVKEWQLKKRDAERKLTRSGEHALQVQALLAELKPYLNNLRSQMKRWEKRDEYARRLQELKELKVYVRLKSLQERRIVLDKERAALQEAIRRMEEEKQNMTSQIIAAEKEFGSKSSQKEPLQDTKLQELYEKRMQLERELIKIESQLSGYAVSRKGAPDLTAIFRKISEIRSFLEELSSQTSFEMLKDGVLEAAESLQAMESLFSAGSSEIPKEMHDAQEKTKEAIGKIERELDEVKLRSREAHVQEQQLKETLFQKERALRRLEDDLERALEKEASLMGELGRHEGEERGIFQEAREHIPDAPAGLAELLRVLETTFGGREVPLLQRIEEDIIRASVHLSDVGELDPNMKSEYEKVDERFNFLSKELEDVRGAKDDLQKLVVDLAGEIQKKFEEAFLSVNKEFSKYMQTIFGGGKGELIKLVPPKRKTSAEDDPEDMGNEEEEQEKEGIVVRVELPGKRIKSLELLSGGERALTSLAFLFAIIATVKPPFVVLDEVDAALDEANSKRFANLLESVRIETQCIVVTHNRSTMAAAQALYGVTMGGDGISRILSLKLES
ncbi:MAG: AAA family ATPase [bacterium]|nr:AAA family ATPase [bacterium]